MSKIMVFATRHVNQHSIGVRPPVPVFQRTTIGAIRMLATIIPGTGQIVHAKAHMWKIMAYAITNVNLAIPGIQQAKIVFVMAMTVVLDVITVKKNIAHPMVEHGAGPHVMTA